MSITSSPRARRATVPVLLALVAGAACGDDPTGPESIEDTTFADALGIRLADFAVTGNGVYVRDDEVGEGDPVVTGSAPVVEIEGWLPNGAVFQQRIVFGDDANEEFVIGAGDVIPGFEEGIRGDPESVGASRVLPMRVGGTRRIIIPAELAYGQSPVVFEITLLELGEAAAP